jgi:polysaccharide export outer membrane protein
MRKSVALVPLLWAGLLSSPAGGQTARPQSEGQAPAQPGDASVPAFRIGPEDVLIISVWQNAELTRSVPVRPDGRFSLPLVKEIQAAGRTPAELGNEIESLLKSYMTSAVVSVIVAEVNSYRVSVLGKVAKPGRYNFKAPTSILEALAAAGGPIEYSNPDETLVLRPDPRPGGGTNRPYQRYRFNYSMAIKASGPAAANFELLPNDIIVVP